MSKEDYLWIRKNIEGNFVCYSKIGIGKPQVAGQHSKLVFCYQKIQYNQLIDSDILAPLVLASLKHRSEKEGMKMLSGKQAVVLFILLLLLPLWWVGASLANPATEQEIRENINIFKSPTSSIADCDAALSKLAAIGEPAIPALLKALKEGDPDFRMGAAIALARMGAPAILAMIQALQDEDPRVRYNAAYVLGFFMPFKQSWGLEPGDPAVLAVQALILALKDKESKVREAAEEALGRMGRAATPTLIKTLLHEDPEVRKGVVNALGSTTVFNIPYSEWIDKEPQETVPVLITLLQEKDPKTASSAAKVLGWFGPRAQTAVPPLILALQADNPEVRKSAISTLGKIGPAAQTAIPVLITMLQDEDPRIVSSAANALGGFGPAAQTAVPALIPALQADNREVSQAAFSALVQIGPAAQEAVPVLITMLQHKDPEIVWSAANTLGQIGPMAQPAVPALIKVLQDKNPAIQSGAFRALEQIGPAAQEAVPVLTRMLMDENPNIRWAAAMALGGIGPGAEAAVPVILEAFKDGRSHDRPMVAGAILKIVQPDKQMNREALQRKLLQLEDLSQQTLFTDLDSSVYQDLKGQLALMVRTVRAEIDKQTPFWAKWVEKHKLQEKWWAWALAAYSLLIILTIPCWLLLLWVRPLWLYLLNEKASWWSFKITYLDQSVGLHQMLLLSPFHYCNRVLDAWVQNHINQARASFAALKTVQDRAVHVPVPITLNGHTLAQPSPQDFYGVFQKAPFCLLIWGEGGSGKTSLACQLAEWGLAGETEPALAGHPMLPILIEHDLSQHSALEAINKQMEIMTGGEKISPSLLNHLLRRQRLLVIVDHYSEMNRETQEHLQPGYDPQLPLHALIVTSRQEEELQGAVTDTLKPLRIRGNRLSSFLEAYLTQLDKRELYEDAEFFVACSRLTEMVGDRNITVLLARMFADQMIATKEEPDFEALPDNIPDLMLSYLNWINRHESEKNPGNKAVHRIVKAISWAGLEPTFRPTEASLAAINTALAAELDLAQKLDYLCRDLGIVQCVGPAEDKMRITLDPVAEYLAGLHLLELYGGQDERWKGFLEETDKKEGAPQSIEGFLLAVRDCCLAKGKEFGIPGFVEQELAEKVGIKSGEQGRLFAKQVS